MAYYMRKPSKYHNQKTKTIDGIEHDSKKEALRWMELQMLQRAGEISELRRQVTFELIPKQVGERACNYIADFVYVDNKTNRTVVEDAKGVRTDVYKIKKKLMLWRYDIRIKEV